MSMGTGEAVTPTKTAKTSAAQDQPAVPTSYAEWAAAFQAYYNGASPPPGYFPPGMAPGPQPHPYMWAGQPVMPPYGTAPPYSAMYPGGHAYGHPTMPQGPHPYPYSIMSPGNATEATPVTTLEADCKSSDGKKQSPLKKSKESAGSPRRPTNKGGDSNKGASTSANGCLSQSGESGSDGSSDGSEDDNGKNMLRKRSSEQTSEGGSFEIVSHATGQTTVSSGNQVTALANNVGARAPGGLVATTGLNVGVDYWAAASQGASAAGKGNHNPAMTQALIPTFPNGPYMGAVGREGGGTDHWVQDERELKRQRRKQSNRESARRSRLRKQAECEELAARVDALTAENRALRTEISRVVEERNKLSADNSALLERLKKTNGDEAGDAEEQGNDDLTHIQSQRQENGEMADGFSAEHFRAQGRNSRGEESTNSVEHVSTGLNIGGRAAALNAN
ncbi:hypothetical protein O6H91_20G037300 [Diphasiastrum complanatum]|uniref:Uncharacterized protein n=2 Tax=Diphasiastrum complanatum TaxID=34168 RepID=A0ACC2APK2_DIPCM|nr:hypothetical protein O6H91_20G037300 [Diphasiastrum complanatum]KAJ7519416.1 hypothetical protein O6H91_20G037300 [Diphasiastrum complanatum]